MTSLSRVVWSEGMHLAQHQFQAQARYFEELPGFALQNLFFAPWGWPRANWTRKRCSTAPFR